MDTVSKERLRWRCRRGLLELDLVLGRFIEHYAELDSHQRSLFDELLDLPDTQLWDMICGRTVPEQAEHAALLERINQA